MRIKILGTRGEVEESAPRHAKHSGVLVDDILFDIGEKEFLDYKPKAIFLTHLHPDHAYFLREKEAPELKELKIYAPEQWKEMKDTFVKVKKAQPIEIDSYRITPIPTTHSKKVKSTAYLIEKDGIRILYTADMIWIRKKYHNLLKDLDLVITDGSFNRKGGMIRREKETGEIYGHQGIPNLVEFFKKLNAKRIIFTHFGSWFLKDPEKGKEEIRKYSNDMKVEAAYDGKELELEEKNMLGTTTTQDVEPVTKDVVAKLQPKAGLYLVPPHAQMIAEGTKTLIIKSKKFTSHIGEPLYLIEDSLCYGIITLKEPYEIDYDTFVRLRDRHQVSDKEAFERWGWDKKAPLYAYEFSIDAIFDEPIPVKIPRGVQVFVDAKNIKFKEIKTLTMLELLDLSETCSDEMFVAIYPEMVQRGLASETELLIKEATKDWVEQYIKNLKKYTRAQIGDDWRICVTPDTPVIANPGVEYISEVKPSQQVKEVLCRTIDEEVVTVKPRYLLPVTFTKEHPILTLPLMHSKTNSKVVPKYIAIKSRDKNGQFVWYVTRETPKWKMASELQYFDGVQIPKLPEKYTSYPEELFALAGWYLAEGFISREPNKAVRFSLHRDEVAYAHEILTLCRKLTGKWNVGGIHIDNGQGIRVDFNDKELTTFLVTHFGKGARNKTIPRWVLEAEKEKVWYLLDAYYRGDGWTTEGYLKANTVSKKLAIGIWLLWTKFSRIASLQEITSETNFGKCTSYEISLSEHKKDSYYEDQNSFWLPITKIVREHYRGKVWNLETSSNTYQVPFTVHNCLGWYSSIKRGKKLFKHTNEGDIPITEEDCKKLAVAIVKELISRGATFNRPETYKKYARELFEYVIREIGEKNIPWKDEEKKAKLDPEKVTRADLEQIDDVYVKTLSDEQLKKLHDRLHQLEKEIGKVTEPLENAHIFVWNEMKHRNIQHPWLGDELDRRSALEVVEYPQPEIGEPQEILTDEDFISLEEALKAFPKEIVVSDPIHVYLCGRIVNEGKIPKSHDIDLLFKQGWYHVPTIHAFLDAVSANNPEVARRFHFVWDAKGPHIGYTVPLYRLAFVQVSPEEMKRTSPFEFLAGEKAEIFKPYIGLKPKCYTEDTEVLTKEGWKFIKDITFRDKVATLKDGYTLTWSKPLKLFEYDWDGPIIHFTGHYLDLKVTPEHKMYVKRGFERTWQLSEAKDLVHDFFRIKRNFYWRSKAKPPKEFLGMDINDFLYLLGIYLAEGSVRHRKTGGWEITLALFDPAWEDEVSSLLSKYGIKVHKYQKGVLTFWSEQLGRYFYSLGKAHTKYIPQWVKQLPRPYLLQVFKGLYKGDGSKKYQRYTTVSKQLADDFQELALKLGYSSHISTYGPNYYVYFGNRHRPRVNQDKKHARVEHYKGKVYCLEVPGHLLFVRRNGKPCWSGNSGFEKNEFWDVKEMWEKWAKHYIDRGIMIQKKYDGMRFQIHCKGNQVKIITEDRQRDRASVFKKSVEELLKNKKADSFILDAEMVEYNCGGKKVNDIEYCEPIAREEMIKWIGAERKELDDEYIIFHVHDCTYLNGEAINDKGYLERWKAIDEVFPQGLRHWKKVNGEIAYDMKTFFRLVKKYRSLSGSEGVVAKAIDSKYPIKYSGENRTGEWAKLKNLKEIDVMVWKVIQKKTKEGKPLPQYLYDCVFAIPCSDVDKYREKDVVKIGNKCYLYIGRTYATAEKVKPGDIIVVRPIRVAEFKDPKGKLYYTWMFPYYDGKHPAKKEPDSIDVVKKLVAIGTGPPKEQLTTEIINLPLCPYWLDSTICPLKDRFRIPRYMLSKVLVEYLKYPIVCKFANHYRCRYVKSYYYGYKEYQVKSELDEDTGEEINENKS
jgi:ribonuclease BN (tRNA processing enzyme)